MRVNLALAGLAARAAGVLVQGGITSSFAGPRSCNLTRVVWFQRSSQTNVYPTHLSHSCRWAYSVRLSESLLPSPGHFANPSCQLGIGVLASGCPHCRLVSLGGELGGRPGAEWRRLLGSFLYAPSLVRSSCLESRCSARCSSRDRSLWSVPPDLAHF